MLLPILLLPLPSDNVQHDLQHWSLITSWKKKTSRTKGNWNCYLYHAFMQWGYDAIILVNALFRRKCLEVVRVIFAVIPCNHYTTSDYTTTRLRVQPRLYGAQDEMPFCFNFQRQHSNNIVTTTATTTTTTTTMFSSMDYCKHLPNCYGKQTPFPILDAISIICCYTINHHDIDRRSAYSSSSNDCKSKCGYSHGPEASSYRLHVHGTITPNILRKHPG